MKTTHMMDANMQEWTVHHQDDYRGDVVIQVFPERVEFIDADQLSGEPARQHVRIPFQILKEFVGRALQDREIEILEDELGVRFLDRVTGHPEESST